MSSNGIRLNGQHWSFHGKQTCGLLEIKQHFASSRRPVSTQAKDRIGSGRKSRSHQPLPLLCPIDLCRSLRGQMSTTTAVTTITRRSQPGSVSSADRCQRRRQRPTFESAYADACIRYKTRPSQAVKINGQTDTLTVCGDRLRVDDWRAVADALSVDLSTHHVCLVNRRRTDDGPYRQYDTYRAAADAPRWVPSRPWSSGPADFSDLLQNLCQYFAN